MISRNGYDMGPLNIKYQIQLNSNCFQPSQYSHLKFADIHFSFFSVNQSLHVQKDWFIRGGQTAGCYTQTQDHCFSNRGINTNFRFHNLYQKMYKCFNFQTSFCIKKHGDIFVVITDKHHSMSFMLHSPQIGQVWVYIQLQYTEKSSVYLFPSMLLTKNNMHFLFIFCIN